jgi:hypothetical protein
MENLPESNEQAAVVSDAFRYILHTWMEQSRALYDMQNPKFFRFFFFIERVHIHSICSSYVRDVAAFVSDCGDTNPKMNQIKVICFYLIGAFGSQPSFQLMLLRGKANRTMDSELHLMQTIRVTSSLFLSLPPPFS